MKIAVIAPPWISIPPPKYGGIELVVYNLVEGLSALGHDVILFAHKDSIVSSRCLPYIETPLHIGLDSPEDERSLVGELSSKYAYARAGYEKVDIIHDHTLFKSPVKIPTVHTVHGAALEGSVRTCMELSKDHKNHLVAISNRQKELYLMLNRGLNFAGVVHHAIDVKAIEWAKEKEDYFLFVGRSSWQKGVDVAIRVASKARVGLVMVVKMIEQYEKEFFTKEIEPMISDYPKDLLFKFYREIPRETLFHLMKRAKCTLFTGHWEEPFGLVMLESMACGTPVIAIKRGAAPEVIIEGKTGFLVETEDAMVEAVKRVNEVKPEDCRNHVEADFSREKMANNYLKVYQKILSKK